jgi:hypothetical protein
MDKILETLLNTLAEIDRIRMEVNNVLHEMGTDPSFDFKNAKEYLTPLLSFPSKYHLARMRFLIRAAFVGQLAGIDSLITQYNAYIQAVGTAAYQMMLFSNANEVNAGSEGIRTDVKRTHAIVSRQVQDLLDSLDGEYRTLV